MLGVSGMPVSGAVGKLGDLGDRPSDKIRTLICLDWDPDCMFPYSVMTEITTVCFLSGMAWDAVAFHMYAACIAYCRF